MHKSRRVGTAVVALILLVATAVPVFAASPIFIPMISKGFQHQFWQTVMKGPKTQPISTMW